MDLKKSHKPAEILLTMIKKYIQDNISAAVSLI